MTEPTEAHSDPTRDAIRGALIACGGVGEVANWFGINRVSVWEWISKGRIPSERAPLIAERAREKGHVVALADICPPVPWEKAREHMNATE